TYTKVGYKDVYPGIDLVYYGNQNRLEYDLVVAPGADPAAIKLAFDNAPPQVDGSGDLVLAAGSGEVRLRKPQVYQDVAGIREPVEGAYALHDGSQAGFRLAAYDATLPLVIDPVLDYSSYLGSA